MAQGLPSYQVAFRRQLHEKLVKHFNDDELKRLCSLHLGVNYEELPNGSLSQKALALIEMVERHGRRADLLQACKEMNRAGNWEAGGVILVNVSGRAFTDEQCVQVEALRGKCVLRVIEVSKILDNDKPFEPQVRAIIETYDLCSQFQTSDPETIIGLPPLAAVAGIFLAIAHAHKGSLPSILRLRSTGGEKWAVAEIIDLGEIRRAELASRA